MTHLSPPSIDCKTVESKILHVCTPTQNSDRLGHENLPTHEAALRVLESRSIHARNERHITAMQIDTTNHSLNVLRKIARNTWHYVLNICKHLHTKAIRFDAYTACGANAAVVTAILVGAERYWQCTPLLAGKILSTTHNIDEIRKLRTTINENVHSVSREKGFVYEFSLSPTCISSVIYGGHAFVIEQLPKNSESDPTLYRIHMSYLDQYSLEYNLQQYGLEREGCFSHEEILTFIDNLQIILESDSWTDETDQAYFSCFHQKHPEMIGKPIRDRSSAGLPNYSKGIYLTTAWQSYDPSQAQEHLDEILSNMERKGTEHVQDTLEREYANKMHILTLDQNMISPIKAVEKVVAVYELIMGNEGNFNFAKAKQNLLKQHTRRHSHPYRPTGLRLEEVYPQHDFSSVYNESFSQDPSLENLSWKEVLNTVSDVYKKVLSTDIWENDTQRIIEKFKYFTKGVYANKKEKMDYESAIIVMNELLEIFSNIHLEIDAPFLSVVLRRYCIRGLIEEPPGFSPNDLKKYAILEERFHFFKNLITS